MKELDTRTKTPEEIEAEKNSTAIEPEFSNEPIEHVAPPTPSLKAIKRQKQLQSRLNTSTVNVEPIAKAYFFNELSKNDWSRMSPALRKCIERYIKQHKAELIAEKKKRQEEAIDVALKEAAENIKAAE